MNLPRLLKGRMTSDRAGLQTLAITTDYRHISHLFLGNPEAKNILPSFLWVLWNILFDFLSSKLSASLLDSPLTFISSKKLFLGQNKLSQIVLNRTQCSNIAVLRCHVSLPPQKWPSSPQCDLLASAFVIVYLISVSNPLMTIVSNGAEHILLLSINCKLMFLLLYMAIITIIIISEWRYKHKNPFKFLSLIILTNSFLLYSFLFK